MCNKICEKNAEYALKYAKYVKYMGPENAICNEYALNLNYAT